MHFSVLFVIYMVLFVAGCVIGYLLEVCYRRFAAGKWVNPGFMQGPWLPIYGLGLLLMFTVCLIIESGILPDAQFYNPTGTLFWRSEACGPRWMDLIPIFFMGAGMILLEFIAGIIFIKGFKVKLWDYTNFKGNIMGIICPQFNVIWFMIAVIYYYGINPFVFDAFNDLLEYMTATEMASVITHFGFSFTIGAVYGIFILDLVKSLGLFSKIVKITKESKAVGGYEKLREIVSRNIAKLQAAIPENVKEKSDEFNEKRKQEASKFRKWLRKAVYIDPDKITSEDQYDENGRPMKTE